MSRKKLKVGDHVLVNNRSLLNFSKGRLGVISKLQNRCLSEFGPDVVYHVEIPSIKLSTWFSAQELDRVSKRNAAALEVMDS